MADEGSRAPASVLHSPVDVLRLATSRVAARLDEVYPPLAPGGSDRAAAYLGTLGGKLEAILGGADPKPISEWLQSSPLFAPLHPRPNAGW